jgi:hypothetical protein
MNPPFDRHVQASEVRMTKRLLILFAAAAFSAVAAEPQAAPRPQQEPARSAQRQQEAAKPARQQQQQAAPQAPVPPPANDCPVGSQCYETRKLIAQREMFREAEAARVREEALRRAQSRASLCSAGACGSCDGICLRPTAQSACVCSAEKQDDRIW